MGFGNTLMELSMKANLRMTLNQVRGNRYTRQDRDSKGSLNRAKNTKALYTIATTSP